MGNPGEVEWRNWYHGAPGVGKKEPPRGEIVTRCPSGIGALLLICRIGPASLFASVAFLFGSAGLAHAQQMYWADLLTYKIQRANLDGSSVVDLLTEEEVSVPWGVAIDRHAGKIYWAENKVRNSRGHRIRRANLDGSNIEDVIVNLPNRGWSFWEA